MGRSSNNERVLRVRVRVRVRVREAGVPTTRSIIHPTTRSACMNL